MLCLERLLVQGLLPPGKSFLHRARHRRRRRRLHHPLMSTVSRLAPCPLQLLLQPLARQAVAEEPSAPLVHFHRHPYLALQRRLPQASTLHQRLADQLRLKLRPPLLLGAPSFAPSAEKHCNRPGIFALNVDIESEARPSCSLSLARVSVLPHSARRDCYARPHLSPRLL
jgi:hypothetical protein